MEGVPGPHPHTKFHRSDFKMWAQPQKSRTIAIFWYKFAPIEKIWGSTEKVEYRCSTTNLPACNDTIIVLIIILPHSVSIITNFVIPKRDKQTKTSYFFVYIRPATHDPHHTWHGDRGGRTILHPIIFLIRSVVSPRGYWKFDGKYPHRWKMLITWLFVP